MHHLRSHVGQWDGGSTFRMMPTDEFSPGPSSARTEVLADGFGWALHYDWTHPSDGVQSGTLLIGSADDEGVVTAGWIDSWHQKPQLAVLTGSAVEGRIHVEMEYGGWGWTIDVFAEDDGLRMIMNNVIPEGIDIPEEAEGVTTGPYVVMDAGWWRSGSAPLV